MPRHGESIWKRNDGRWEARYISARDESGKAHYSSVYACSYKEVKKKRETAVAMINEQNQEMKGPDIPVSFSDIANLFLISCKTKIKESSLAQYKDLLTWYIYPYFRDKSIASLSKEELARFSASLICSGGKKGVGLSPKTVKDILVLINQILSFAESKGFSIPHSISAEYPRQQSSPIIILSLSDQRVLEDYLLKNQNPVTLGILLTLYTGIRIGELCGLMWCDFNLVDDVLSISRTILRVHNSEDMSNKTKLIVSSPKTTSGSRNIPLHSEIVTLLKDQRQLRDYSDSSYFLTGSDIPTEPRNLYAKYKRILKRIDLQEYTFHALRHTFATRCIENGVDAKVLSEMLGHANVQITLNRYVHPSFDIKRKAIERLKLQ